MEIDWGIVWDLTKESLANIRKNWRKELTGFFVGLGILSIMMLALAGILLIGMLILKNLLGMTDQGILYYIVTPMLILFYGYVLFFAENFNKYQERKQLKDRTALRNTKSQV